MGTKVQPFVQKQGPKCDSDETSDKSATIGAKQEPKCNSDEIIRDQNATRIRSTRPNQQVISHDDLTA